MNYLKTTFLLFLITSFLFVSLGFTTFSDQSRVSIITGKIKNYEKYSNTKIVGLCAQGFGPGFGPDIKEAKVQSDGSFQIEITQDEPREFVLKPFFNVHIYTHPGDRVELTIDLDNTGGTFFEGNTKEDNTKLNQYYLDGFFTHERTSRRIVESKTPDDFLLYIDSIYRVRQNLLDSFKSKYSPSNRLYNNLKALILNNHYQQLIRYGLFINRNSPGVSKEISGDESFRYFNNVFENLNKDFGQMTSHPSYEHSLSLYQAYLLQLFMPEVKRTPDLKESKAFANRVVEISKKGKPLLNDHLLLSLGSLIIKSNLDHFDSLRSIFEKNIHSADIKALLRQKYSDQKRQIYSIKPLEEFSLEDVMVSEEVNRLISENKGKIIYIDVWATWCSPCVTDMIESRNSVANELMKGDMAVIYAGTGIDQNACEKFIQNNEIPGEFTFLDEEAAKYIMNRFGNHALPFQIIISPQGEIVGKGNRYRFTSYETQKMFDLLRKKRQNEDESP